MTQCKRMTAMHVMVIFTKEIKHMLFLTEAYVKLHGAMMPIFFRKVIIMTNDQVVIYVLSDCDDCSTRTARYSYLAAIPLTWPF